MGEWVVFDYGGVLCADPVAGDRAVLCAAAGVADDAGFWARYWQWREPYDRGVLSDREYWGQVLGRPVTAEEVEAIDVADVGAWSRPYEGTLDLLPRLRTRGVGLALLSNAPVSMAAAVDRMGWTELVPHRFFSCRLGITKPHPDAYKAVLAQLQADPAEVTFVDDRPVNVAGAEQVGIRGLLFTDPATLAADLDLRGDA